MNGKVKRTVQRTRHPPIEKDHGYQAYHSLQWWKDHMENGDQIELSYEDSLGDQHSKKLLFFDTIEHVEMVGADPIDYLCFQKERTTLGNRSVAIPVLPSNVVKIFMIRGEEFTSGKRFRIAGNATEIKHSGSPEPEQVKESIVKTSNNSGIVEKNGRFYCPCGNSYVDKGHAVWNHKNHMNAKTGNEMLKGKVQK
jgi:hypothetical protein